MAKARQPEILFIQRGVTPEWARKYVADAGWEFSSEPKPGPNVIYADKRIIPRVCNRTGMRRDFCCCAPCRSRRRRKHGAACDCWLCYADRMGAWINSLGKRTVPGRWAIFLTQTYRTPCFDRAWKLDARGHRRLILTRRKEPFPWAKGFPIEQPEPHPDFVRKFVGQMIRWLEAKLGDAGTQRTIPVPQMAAPGQIVEMEGPIFASDFVSGSVRERVEYFVAEQSGEIGGRRHQHFALTSPRLVLAAEELSAMRRADPRTTRLPEMLKPFALMLVEKAGFNRILPSEDDAAFYIGRYIGRDAGHSHWDFRVGAESKRPAIPVGRCVVAVSPAPDDSSRAYRQVFGKWHR